jgi:DNA gyrase/topoisomerase IV subunit A
MTAPNLPPLPSDLERIEKRIEQLEKLLTDSATSSAAALRAELDALEERFAARVADDRRQRIAAKKRRRARDQDPDDSPTPAPSDESLFGD